MTFHSILFRTVEDEVSSSPGMPIFFIDLHLNQIVDSIVKGKEAYDLRPLFEVPLRSVDAILFRNEVMRDVETTRIYEVLTAFASGVKVVRDALTLSSKSSYPDESMRWMLDAVQRYCFEVRDLAKGLNASDVRSRGLCDLREWLETYMSSEPFQALADESAALLTELERVEYQVLIGSGKFTVRDVGDEGDLIAVVHDLFARFRTGTTKSYLLDFAERPLMNHIEAKVLEFVRLLNPNVFARLARFASEHADFVSDTIRRFQREIQFYVACTDYTRRLTEAGLPTCYPRVDHDKAVHVEDGFDLALANRLIETDSPVIRNDFALSVRERVFVVSGPNQGGKTTFARTFGQMQYLAALGCRVAGRSASTFLFDALFTHFEREEVAGSLRGKLEDDVIRIHEILERATPDSVIILNEIFASTTAHDASLLARNVMERILDLDALCVCVTFIDELASLSEKTVSVVSLVDPHEPDVRTYRLERRPADGLAYAVSLARKYSLTYDRLRSRLSNGPIA